MGMGGKRTEGGPGPVVLDGQVLESSSPATPARPSCWRCDGTKRIEVRKYFPATKYQREGVLITDEPCPRCVGRTDGAP